MSKKLYKKPCIFLDRDGVLNQEIGAYVYRDDQFKILDGVTETLKTLSQMGYLLIIITNQGGISKGLYSQKEVWNCFEHIQRACGGVLTDMYFAPLHPSQSNSLSFKPNSLMFEKAIAKYNINPFQSWMIGDKETDLIPAISLGIETVWISQTGNTSPVANCVYPNLKTWFLNYYTK